MGQPVSSYTVTQGETVGIAWVLVTPGTNYNKDEITYKFTDTSGLSGVSVEKVGEGWESYHQIKATASATEGDHLFKMEAIHNGTTILATTTFTVKVTPKS